MDISNIVRNHLAMYLPYDLQLERINYKHEQFKTLTAYDLTPEGEIHNIIMLLKPMSYLTIEELEKQDFWHHIDWLTYELQTAIQKNGMSELTKRINDAPFEMVQYLISQHYDILGLIEAGIAKSNQL